MIGKRKACIIPCGPDDPQNYICADGRIVSMDERRYCLLLSSADKSIDGKVVFVPRDFVYDCDIYGGSTKADLTVEELNDPDYATLRRRYQEQMEFS